MAIARLCITWGLMIMLVRYNDIDKELLLKGFGKWNNGYCMLDDDEKGWNVNGKIWKDQDVQQLSTEAIFSMRTQRLEATPARRMVAKSANVI